MLANSETETCFWECALFTCPTIPPCSAKVDVLATSDVPGATFELDPKGDKITCPAFFLHFSQAEHSKMGHVVLDLTNLAYQPATK